MVIIAVAESIWWKVEFWLRGTTQNDEKSRHMFIQLVDWLNVLFRLHHRPISLLVLASRLLVSKGAWRYHTL